MDNKVVTLSDIIDIEVYHASKEAGLISTQVHPTLPYTIHNYSKSCTWENAWNEATLACRGLITHSETGEVLARPFKKFFNHNQEGAPVLDLSDKITVTDKVDGCFLFETKLNLWGGGTIAIGDIVKDKLQPTLIGMNKVGQLVPTKVVDWHNNGTKDNWLDLTVDCRVSRQSGSGGYPNKIRVTSNHHLYVNGGYLPAGEVRAGDKVVTSELEPSAEIIRLIEASLLGDGYLGRSPSSPFQAKYTEAHSEHQSDYADYLARILGNTATKRRQIVSGYGSQMFEVASKEYRALGFLHDKWYGAEGIKGVPEDLSWLDDFAVAKWMMDDGCRSKFKAQADRITFATHSFTKDGIERLGDRLAEMYGISYHLKYDVRCDGYSLIINSGRKKEILRMWAAITPHIIPSMRYKVPEDFQALPFVEYPTGEEQILAREVEVLAISTPALTKKNFPFGRVGFDVSTETENYFAKGVLVHNSLGVLYPISDGGYAIATRGSFASDQAIRATQIWNKKYAGDFVPNPAWSYLFEIIFPENRIVINYGDLEDLILLGVVDIATGKDIPLSEAGRNWTGRVVATFPYSTYEEALLAPARDNAEGFVLFHHASGERVKIKQEDYIRLHRILTNVNARSVWELLAAGEDPVATFADAPDEFHTWLKAIIAEFESEHARIAKEAQDEHESVLLGLPEGWGRKDYAMAVLKNPLKGYLFALLDGKDISPMIWDALRPVGLQASQKVFTEDIDA